MEWLAGPFAVDRLTRGEFSASDWHWLCNGFAAAVAIWPTVTPRHPLHQAARGILLSSSNTRRNAKSGAVHMVRYVSRKASQAVPIVQLKIAVSSCVRKPPQNPAAGER